jgi:hypothetical protein
MEEEAGEFSLLPAATNDDAAADMAAEAASLELSWSPTVLSAPGSVII